MKIISKAKVIQYNQQEHIMSEKTLLAEMDHPFIIQLMATFKDSQRLYMVLEYCPGGEVRLEGHVGQVTSLVMGNGMLFSGGQARSVFFLLSSLFFVVVAEAGNRQRGMQNHSTHALTRTHALNIRRIKPFGCGSRP